MGFVRKTMCGYKEMWDKITTKINTSTEAIKTWCSDTFSLKSHDHDTKYDSKGSASTVQTNLNTHNNNTTKHITASERTTWNNKANGSHTHTTSQISGLDTALAGKSPIEHSHTLSSLGGIGFPSYSNVSGIQSTIPTSSTVQTTTTNCFLLITMIGAYDENYRPVTLSVNGSTVLIGNTFGESRIYRSGGGCTLLPMKTGTKWYMNSPTSYVSHIWWQYIPF